MTRAGGNRSGHLMIVLSTARIDDKTEDKETIGSPDGFGLPWLHVSRFIFEQRHDIS